MNSRDSNTCKYGCLVKQSPKTGIVVLVLIGLGVLYFVYYIYKNLSLFEQEGGRHRLPRFVVVIYEALGIWGATLLFVASGLYFFYLAYDAYNKILKK